LDTQEAEMNNACRPITSLFVIAAMLLLNGQRKRKIIASASALHRQHNAFSIAIAEKFQPRSHNRTNLSRAASLARFPALL
jgi:hypothetical protein